MQRILVLISFLLLPLLAQAEESVVLGLSKDTIEITTNFDGSNIMIYGAVKRETPAPQNELDVIVTLSGPSETLAVRRKERWFGIWVNKDTVEIDAAPSFYAIATTRPWDEIISDTENLRHTISIPNAIRSVGAPMDVTNAQDFSEAVIRINKNKGKYILSENTVKLREGTLFSTAIQLPADLTEGDYETKVFLLRDKKVVSEFVTMIDVRKVGLERFLYNLSRQQPLIYGLMSLAIAIFAGWGASAVFQVIRSR